MNTIQLALKEYCVVEEIKHLSSKITNDNFANHFIDILDGKFNSVILKLKNPEILNGLIFVNVKILIFDTYAHLSKIAFSFPNVRQLNLWNVKEKADLSYLYELPNCKRLDLFKSAFFTRISLTNITELYAQYISFDQQQLFNFPGLKYISLGSTQNGHNAGLNYLSKLRLLVLGWEKSGTEHLNDLSFLSNLQAIYTFRASKLSHLPDLSNNSNFKAISVNETHKLTDISGLYEAPNLDVVSIVHCKGLKPEAFYPLKGNPTLKRLYFGTSIKDQDKVMNYLSDIWDPTVINMEYVLPDLK